MILPYDVVLADGTLVRINASSTLSDEAIERKAQAAWIELSGLRSSARSKVRAPAATSIKAQIARFVASK